ncbi:hypothetical protein N7495_002199 [Penicillium taxi]|uniref:uncharacterized protein n=1 Tax=Penicillium taxi TaxID=168475 RepID=UPI002545A849|nr:uncharacterized protein N7495_002199 [Penicillium taxi]KAJ5901671.1 hypothetical protein N7495_002199 [Penicillium taxi]
MHRSILNRFSNPPIVNIVNQTPDLNTRNELAGSDIYLIDAIKYMFSEDQTTAMRWSVAFQASYGVKWLFVTHNLNNPAKSV